MRHAGWRTGVLTAAFVLLPAGAALAQDAGAARPGVVEGDGMPNPLTTEPGDAQRGREIVASRTLGLCLLCHSGPFPEQPRQGTLAPTLAGAGDRLTEAQLRLRLVDGRRLNPLTIMPSYHRADGLERVGRSWRGKPVLTAQQIEDVVAFLRTLRER